MESKPSPTQENPSGSADSPSLLPLQSLSSSYLSNYPNQVGYIPLRQRELHRELASHAHDHIPTHSAPSTMLTYHGPATLDHTQGRFMDAYPGIDNRRYINMVSNRELERGMASHAHHIPTLSAPSTMPTWHRPTTLDHIQGRFMDAYPEVDNRRIINMGSSSHVRPFSRKTEAIMTSSEVGNARIINLPKPEGNVSGLKRKAVGPSTTSLASPEISSEKKKKTNLWCDLCHVSATSEMALQAHLQGKKHQSRETWKSQLLEGTNEEEVLKNSDDVALIKAENVLLEHIPKTVNNPFWCSVCKLAVNSQIDLDAHLKGIKHALKLSKTSAKQVSKSPEKRDDVAQNIKNHEDVSQENPEEEVPRTLICPFWCEICKLAVTSQIMLDAHLKGKKHAARLLKTSANKVSKSPKENIELEEVTTQMAEEVGHKFVSKSPKEDMKVEEVTTQMAEEDGHNFPFWCGICKIGTLSRKEMDDHKDGKEHASRVLKGHS